LRARQLTVMSATAVTVAGGAGGTETDIGDCAGGAGAPGRIRFDAAVLEGTISALSSAVRGAIWPADTPPIVTDPGSVSLGLVGRAGVEYFIKVNTSTPERAELLQDSGTVDVALERGLNTVCALVVESGSLSQPESLNCISIAYLP
jgi:hypothetical protein